MFGLRWKERWRLFLLETDRRSWIFCLMAFLLNLGFSGGMASANALLVSRVGTEPLFIVYLGSSVLTFLFAGATYLLVDKFRRAKIFLLSFELFAVAILLLWWALNPNFHLVWPYFAARILSDVFFVLALFQFWLLAGDYFTNLEAKLRFPLFVAASGLGYMCGGLLLQLFAEQIQARNFFLLWSLCLAVLPFFMAWLPSLTKNGEGNALPVPESTEHPPGQGKEFSASASRLLRILFLFWVAFVFFSYGVDYFFNKVALESLPNENQLAAFFGQVSFFSLLAVFFFQLFIAGRLAMALSVDRSMLLLCFLLFLGSCLVAWSPSLGAVAISEGLLFYFLDSKAVALLQPVGNLFPDRLRGRVKVILDGFAPAAGDLCLLLVASILSWTLGIAPLAYVLAGGSALFLAYPFLFRRAYLQYLTDCLESTDPKLLLNAVQALGEPGKKSAAPFLLKLLRKSPDIFLKRNIILSLGRMRSAEALPTVIEHFSVPQESLQLAVVESLAYYRNYPSLFALYEMMKSQDNVSFQVRMSATLLMTRAVGGRMIPLLKEALEEQDVRIRANAIESLALLKDRNIVPLLLPYLKHPSRRLRANTAIALHQFRSHRREALKLVSDLFSSQDHLTRFAGIYAIGELGLSEYRAPLFAMLEHADPRYRQQVRTALAKMGLPDFVETFVASLLEANEGMVLESIRNLSRFPRYSRWRVFEAISKLNRASQERIIACLDQTHLDFSQERQLLTSKGILPSRARH